MLSAQQIPWTRIAVESFAIVGSILLAFAIDAWWQDNQEKQEAQRSLVAIKVELQQNIDWIDQELVYRNAANAQIQELLDASGDEPALSIERTDRLLAGLLWYGVIDFRSGALDSLVQGGRLSIIDSESLRFQLAELSEYYANTNRMEQQTYQALQNLYIPFVVDNTFLPQIALKWVDGRPGGATGGTDQYPFDFPPRPATDHRSLLQDSRFLGLLVWQKAVHDDVIFGYDLLKPILIEVIHLIDAELGLAKVSN